MAKSTSDKTKTTKTDAANKPAAKKSTAAKSTTEKAASKADPKGASTTPESTKTSTTPKSKSTKASGDAGSTLVKKCQEAADKFDKLGDAKYADIKEKLQWCIGSYNHDKNPSGLKEYGLKAVDMLKEARADKPKQVSQKLIDDLEKALAKV